jgi:uncharacterized protein
MRWTPGGQSDNIEDQRSSTGGGGGMRLGLGGIVVLFILSVVFKRDFFSLLNTTQGGMASTTTSQPDPAMDAREKPLVQFVSFVLDDAQNEWKQILPSEAGVQYRDAKLVLFRDAVNSACGSAQSASGPFYCPSDQKVYIDLGFYDELKNRFGASGDFAQAYVLTHEIGHHVQNLLGIEDKVRQAQRANPGAANDLSVRLELQADCLAGVWGHSTAQRNILEQGDVEKALNAAAAIGDDRIQRMSGRGISPESFTHGSSQQRVQWFQAGFNSGNLSDCNTFAN